MGMRPRGHLAAQLDGIARGVWVRPAKIALPFITLPSGFNDARSDISISPNDAEVA